MMVAVVDDEVATAATAVGMPGVPWVRELEAAEAGLLPLALAAFTVNVYTVLAVRPVTVHVVVDPLGVVQVCPPLEVTV